MRKFFTSADKLLHILGCLLIMLYVWAFFFAFGLPWWGFGIALAASLGAGAYKEYYDYMHPATHDFDTMDIVADIIGAVLAVIPVLFIMLNQIPAR